MIRHWRQIPSNELQTIVNRHDCVVDLANENTALAEKNKALRTLLVRVLTLDPDQSRIPEQLVNDIQAEL